MSSNDAAINAPVPSELAQDDIGSIELAVDERRTETRQPYNAIQRFAPYRAGIVPTPEMFHKIRCCNISSGGLAFLTRLAPETPMIVVTTGEEPDVDFHTARVASIKEIATSAGTVYRIGCQFIGRLHLSLTAVIGWFLG
ncbi:MAG: hypothetical protein SGJ19_14620 [Planctomycetia bacterium]|nr:hypothetical protein [Planctomycetia bacterium]